MVDGVRATECLLPMEDTHFVLDISSDEESHFLEEPKFSGSDDDGWLLKLLQEGGMVEPEASAGDDSDEVVVVKEVMAKSKISDKMDADDDDCVILDGDPDKVVAVDDGAADGDSDDLHIVGEKGQVACRDYPHPRHLCVKFSFRSSSHANYCTLCHCYVCDLPAPCSNWGTGTLTTDHCHATDQEEMWKTKRKMLKQKKSEPEAPTPPLANPTIMTRPAIQLPPWQPPPITSFTAPVSNYQPVPYPQGNNNMATSVLQNQTRGRGSINHRNSRSYYSPNAPVFKKTVTLSRSLTVPTNRVTPPHNNNVLRSMSGSNLISNQSLAHIPNLHLHQSSVSVVPSYGRSQSFIQPPNLHFQGMNLQPSLNQQPLVGNYWSNQTDPRAVIGGNNNGFTVSDPQIRSNDGLEDRFVGITVADIENWLFED